MKTLFCLIAEYLDHIRALKYSPETLRKNRLELSRFNKWLDQTFAVRTADQLLVKHLKKWQQHLSTRRTSKGYPLQARTINFTIIKVRGFLIYLAKNGYIRSDLVCTLSNVKEPTHLPASILTHSQAKRFLALVSTDTPLGYRNRTMFELLYSTGIRAGELLGLNITSINFEDHTALVTGKGDKDRVVPIGKTAMRYLKTYVKAVRPYLLKNPMEKALFPSKRGHRLRYSSFRRIITEYSRKLNLDITITAHTFRRSCTTELIRGGANIYHVKQLLGHASLETLDVYTKLTISDLKKTHKKCHPGEREVE